VSVHNYTDEFGNLLFQEVKYRLPDGSKQCPLRRPVDHDLWIWGLARAQFRGHEFPAVQPILYNAQQLHTADPQAPVWIVEGPKDVESLKAIGFIATTNPLGAGKWAVTEEYAHSRLQGRAVYIIPDNDEPGRNHAKAVAQSCLKVTGAVRIVELPNLPLKGDVTDWLEAGGTKEELLRLAAEAPVVEKLAEKVRYERRHDGMYEITLVKGVDIEERLTNFTAQLVGIETVDGGVGCKPDIEYQLLCAQGSYSTTISIKPDEMSKQTWPQTFIGSKTPLYMYPGRNVPDRVTVAILETSPKDQIEERRVLSRTGWRGKGFATTPGLITAEGLDRSIVARLPSSLSVYALPDPPMGAELVEAIRATLRLKDLRSEHATIPLLASTFGCVVTPARLSILIVGLPGCGKTELTTLFLRHFGPDFSSDNPAATWQGTANFIEGLLHQCAYVPMLIDDLTWEDDKERALAHRVLGSLGNGAARGRAERSGKPGPAVPLEGLAFVTAEDWIGSESRTARSIQIPLDSTCKNADRYHAAIADSPLYSKTMAGFIRWCAPRLDELRQYVRQRVAEYEKQEAGRQRHGRYGKSAGWLVAGYELLTRFACESGAIDDAERVRLNLEAEQTIRQVIDRQSGEEPSAKPVQMFLDGLRASLGGGRAYVASVGGAERPRVNSLGQDGDFERKVQVGWTDGETLWLLPAPALRMAKEFAPNKGYGLPHEGGLGAALNGAGMLLARDKSQLTVKRVINGTRQRVWCLKLSTLKDDDSPDESQEEF
jgi:hypothetical protein